MSWGQQISTIDESSKLIKLTDLTLHFPHFDAVIACLASKLQLDPKYLILKFLSPLKSVIRNSESKSVLSSPLLWVRLIDDDAIKNDGVIQKVYNPPDAYHSNK